MTLRIGARSTGPVVGLLLCAFASAQTPGKVSFSSDIAPILAKDCAQCHGPAPAMGNLDLRSRDAALKGGQHGAAIIPGDAAGSRLYKHLTGEEQPQMPMGSRLSDAEIAIIKAWIDSGAQWDSAALPNTAATAREHKFTEQQRKYWAFQKVAKPGGAGSKCAQPGSESNRFLHQSPSSKHKTSSPIRRLTRSRCCAGLISI